MKKIFLIVACLLGCLALNSCLVFDEPGDELEMNQKLVVYEDPSAEGPSGDDSSDEEEEDDDDDDDDE